MKKRVSINEYLKRLREGATIEYREHKLGRYSRKIASDHLREDINYYIKLKRAKL